MDSDLIETATQVLEIESEALAILANNIPEDFVPAIERILKTKGRVLVAGVGKSGHVARKVSATLASTGTPSHYVHPTEASHGDLGMISAEDLVILMSNSGETSEMRDIISHCQRFDVPILAVSSRQDSTLVRAASYRFVLPKAEEACSIGMAPTTSTTMMMALGDALAVALMRKRNFRAEDFSALHPGGQLGAKLATVGQLMHEADALAVVSSDDSMQFTLLEMSAKGFGIAAVCQDEKLLGVISDGDLRRHMDDLLTKSAGEIANTQPVTVARSQFAADALRVMNERKISALIVADEAMRLEGILHIHDLLRAGVI